MNDVFEYACHKCGLIGQARLRPDTIHWAELKCSECGHIWLSNPNKQKQSRRSNKELRYLLPESMQHFCWWCMRTESHLKDLHPVVTMNVHHIVAVSDGGEDIRDNLMLLCNQCHSACHRQRESYKRYLSNGQDLL